MATVISLVSYPFLPAKSGGQKGIALFYKYFSKYHTVTVVTTKANDLATAAGYDVLNIISNSPFRYINIFCFFTLKKIIREKKATHLILEHPYYGWLGLLLKRYCGVKLILHSHNIEALRWKALGKIWWSLLWNYERFTHRHADYNFFIHESDRNYGISAYGLNSRKCITMTYGIEMQSAPAASEKAAAKKSLQQIHHIPEHHTIVLLNGAFKYAPNEEALAVTIKYINPLLEASGLPYRLLICGLNIPEAFLHPDSDKVIIAGFVEDLDLYLTGSDVFINPVIRGGGIKTKLVEALGYNLNAVSTVSGASGIDKELCNGKLLISADGDWKRFAELIGEASAIHSDSPGIFYEHFYWGSSTRKAASFIE